MKPHQISALAIPFLIALGPNGFECQSAYSRPLAEITENSKASQKLSFHLSNELDSGREQSNNPAGDSGKISQQELHKAFANFLFAPADQQTQAEQFLVLNGKDALAEFPLITESISATDLSRLTELRAALELADAKRRKTATQVSLEGELNLAQSIRSLSKQTNVDFEISSSTTDSSSHHWSLKPLPFWQALDQVLDRYQASLSSQFNRSQLSVVPRPFQSSDRASVASYIDGHRIQPIAVCKLQNFIVAEQNSLRIDLEFSWDPQNVPSMIVVPTLELELQCDNGELLLPISTDPLIYSPEGEITSEMSSLFSLPSRQAKKIDRWHGSFLTAFSGALAGVQFDNLASLQAKPITLQSGILNITLEGIEKNGKLFQISVSAHVDNDQIVDGLESLVLDSHQAYLIDAEGERIEHVGWTTDRFNSNDVGMTFLFELEKGLEGCKFVYLAPGAIHTTTHNFEIVDVPLP